eukprot:EG_transcript_25409
MARVAVLLIHFQRAFLDGYWAMHFGADQVVPIRRAAERTARLFERGVLGRLPTMSSRCYLDPPDCDPVPELAEHYRRHAIPWVWKPNTNIMQAAGFAEWLNTQLGQGVGTLVVGGCTTTACVRVSSQAVRRHYGPLGLRVVVDLSLCGARADNYDATRTPADGQLRRLYGARVAGRSAVDLAVLQMQESGVEVVAEYDWMCEANPFGESPDPDYLELQQSK